MALAIIHAVSWIIYARWSGDICGVLDNICEALVWIIYARWFGNICGVLDHICEVVW